MILQRLLIVSLLAASAAAQVVSEPVFTGNEQESFPGPSPSGVQLCIPSRTFNNRADLCTPSGPGVLLSSGWSFMCSISPNSLPLLYGSASGATEITFDQPVSRFGGQFATHSPAPDATFEFYDANGALLLSTVASIPADCTWRWLGWRVAGGAPIKRVVVDGLYSGGFILMDDLEADFPLAQPQPYCTSGTSANGCQPTIDATGNPSVSYAAPCSIDVADLDGQRNGVIFYGLQPLPQLWCFTTGSSYLCVQVPTYRSIAQSSGGTAGVCNGAMSLDWNAFMQASPNALGQPWGVGSKAYFQCWYRDPQSCRFSSMSNGVELTVEP